MIVCIATDVYYPQIGGIAGYYRHLTGLLAAAGHNVIVLTIDEKADRNTADRIQQEDNYTKVVLGASYARYRDQYQQFFRPGSYGAPGWIAMGMAMRDWLKQNHSAFHIDIVETGDYGGAGIFLVDDELPPVIVVGHSSATQLEAYNYMIKDDHLAVIKELEKLSFTYCAGITTHSPMNCDALNKLTGRDIHFTRAPWIPPSIPALASPAIPGFNLVISGLQLTKGAIVMAEATTLVAKQNNAWKVYWTGGDTYSAPGIEKMSVHIEKNYPSIWSTNFIWNRKKEHDAAMKELLSTELAIIPSVWETFNYFALEAVYFQKPLIITEQTGAAYLFKDDKTVITIPSGSAVALADAILNQATTEWKEIPRTGTAERIRGYFSVEKTIPERMEVYKKVSANRPSHQSAVQESLLFLKKYTTPGRKIYHSIRTAARKILKGK